jgi:Zn-dependent protease with chaperone function
VNLRPDAKRAVLGAGLIAVIPWWGMLFCVAKLFSSQSPASLARVAVVTLVLGLLIVWFYPLGWLADLTYKSLLGERSEATRRFRNVADGLALAIGVPAERVEIIAAPVPNVLALPTMKHGLVVVATEGACRLLHRAELEALVASQLVIAGDPWVRMASRFQSAVAPWGFLLAIATSLGFSGAPIGAFVGLPLIFLFAFTTLPRRPDAARDLVADFVAIHTTKNPDAIVRALRSLRPAALVASNQTLGLTGMISDAFAVLSTRKRTSTSLSVNGKVTRNWTTHDEIATELGLRSDRMAAVYRGDFSELGTLRHYVQAWKVLGTADNPYVLTPLERNAAAAAASSVVSGSSLPDL